MNRKNFTMSLLAASLLAAYGVARAETYTVNIPASGAPKCMDAANTQPAGCIPSVPLAGSSTSTTTTDLGPGAAVVPGISSSHTDINAGVNAPPSSGSSSSTDINLNGGTAPSSNSSSTDINLNGAASAPSSSSSSTDLNVNGANSAAPAE